MINLSEIKPNQVSKDIKSYSFLIYGRPKVGKTTLCSSFPGHLVIAPERGYSTIPGVMAVPIDSWADFLQVIAQLKMDNKKYQMAKKKGENYKRMFETICIDIVDILYDYCEKYILAQNGVDKVSDIAYGQGYQMISKEFDEKLRSIVQMGYGLILVTHEKKIQASDEDEAYYTCSLGKRPKDICTRLVDVYGYMAIEETGEGLEHVMHVRSTPQWEAGSRFKYMVDTVPATYKGLKSAIDAAIEEEVLRHGKDIVTEEDVNRYETQEYDFAGIKTSITSLIDEIMGKANEEGKIDDAQRIIASIVSQYLGKSMKLRDATEEQIEQLVMIELELKKVLG